MSDGHRRDVPRVLEAITSAAWAIHPPALEQMIQIVQRAGEGPNALAERLGRPLQNARSVTVRDGVAILPVTGPIVRRANLLTEISGGTSVEVLATDLRAALDDPQVSAVLLDIDSPGGEMTGISALARMIAAGREGQKPIAAHVEGLAASAGYWLASASSPLVVDPTAALGSIGVVSTWTDRREQEARAGIRRVEIVSSQSPGKRPDIDSEDGRAQVQALVDRLADEFIAAVATHRTVDRTHVIERFGRGGLLVGADAVEAGMADRVGDLEALVAELATRGRSTFQGRAKVAAAGTGQGPGMSGQTVPAAPPITLETSTKEHPAMAASLREEGRVIGLAEGLAEGRAQERARILGIQAQALPGHDALVRELVADGSVTIEAAAVRMLAAERQLGASALSRAALTASAVPAIAPAPPPAPSASPIDPSLPLEARCEAEWERDPKLRAEFGSLGAYTAFKRAEGAGRVRILKSNDRRAG